MQFRDLLQTNVIDEWKHQYIAFDELLSEIHSLKCNAFGADVILQSNDSTNCICCKKSNNINEAIDIQHFRDIHKKKASYVPLTDLHTNNPNQLENPLLKENNEKNEKNENNTIDIDEKCDKIDIINKWKSIINDEANKINSFYLSVEQELFNEYTLICNRLDKLHQKYQSKQLQSNNNHDIFSISLSDIDSQSQLSDNSNNNLSFRKNSSLYGDA
eukprot:85659_1